MLKWTEIRYGSGASCQLHRLTITVFWEEGLYRISSTFGKLTKTFKDMDEAKSAAEVWAKKTIELLATELGGKVEWKA